MLVTQNRETQSKVKVSRFHLPRVENWKHLPSRNKSQARDLKGDTGSERGREKQQELMGYREAPRWGEMAAAANVTLRAGSCPENESLTKGRSSL